MSKPNKKAKLFLCDDPIDAEKLTEEQQAKRNEWYKELLEDATATKGNITQFYGGRISKLKFSE